MRPFKIAEREISAEAREIRVEGELDLAVAAQLQSAIADCSTALVVIDLEHCSFIDSTGIAVIVQAHRDRAGEGGRVLVHSARDQVLRVLTVAGLAGNGLLFPDRDEAISTVGTSS